jgi:ferritin-like metal-binding protein YciE
MNTLHEMFEDGIKDIHNAEKQLLKALPKFSKLANSERLRTAFDEHTRQTEEQIRRVEKACEGLGMKPTGMICAAMKGLIEEGNEHTKGLKPSPVTDAELIALAQKNEHYEIATYGTLVEWCRVMGHTEAMNLFQQNLDEEKQTDELLNQIAMDEVNKLAADESNQRQMEGRGNNGKSRSRSSGSRGKSSSTRSKSGSSRAKSPAGRASVM